MHAHLFNEFLTGHDTLQVYEGDRLIYTSNKDGLLPLLEYIDRFTHYQQVVIFDKLIGNAAALLSIKAGCCEVYSPLGSHIAVNTLDKYNVTNHINKLVPYIRKTDGNDMCQMEKLSIDAEPQEFYEILKKVIN